MSRRMRFSSTMRIHESHDVSWMNTVAFWGAFFAKYSVFAFSLVKPQNWRLSPRSAAPAVPPRSEEHTSELQSPCNLVCRLLLEKKKKKYRSRLCYASANAHVVLIVLTDMRY